jgi:hypothetical protein
MLSASEPKDQAMYLVLQAVVCILHLKNRVGLKSIESIENDWKVAFSSHATFAPTFALSPRQNCRVVR